MTTKKTPRSRKPAKTAIKPRRQAPDVVLDAAVHLSTHVTQHVAFPFDTDMPISAWTREEFIEAAVVASAALPRKEALQINHATWDRGVLTLSISGDGGGPFMWMDIAECPLEVFHRCFSDDTRFATAILNRIPVRQTYERNGDGVPIAPGTVWDEYAHDEHARDTPPGRLDDWRELDRMKAIQAARKAARLPRRGMRPS